MLIKNSYLMDDRVERIIYTSNSNPGYIIGGFILGVGATCAFLSIVFIFLS